MSPNFKDRRVQRTRQLLRQALLELVPEKGYSAISIQDVTDRANLGKATFYLHYKDKDELLYECMDAVLLEFTEKIHSLPDISWRANDPRPLQVAFEFVAKNATFIKIFMNDPGGLIFFKRLQKIVTNKLLENMKTDLQALHSQPAVPLEFLSTYFGGAMLATIEWWVEHDTQYSIPEIVELISQVGRLDRGELLGAKPAG